MVVSKRLKKAIDGYLEKLAQKNEQTFTNGPLDCCQLNRENKNKK